MSIIEKSNVAGKFWGVGRKGPQKSCSSAFSAHQDGCSPHTEELRRSDSPSASSIAVTVYDGRKTESPTFCQGKEKELVTLAPTPVLCFTYKNSKPEEKLSGCSDFSAGGEPYAEPCTDSTHCTQGSSPGPENAIRTTQSKQAGV